MIVNAGYRGKVGGGVPKFTYTGNYNVRDDGVVELLTSGTITFLNPAVIDVFCVGGGGAGGTHNMTQNASQAGGGGGYCSTALSKKVSGSYQVTVGNGGIPGRTPTNGETTSFGEIVTASGGFTPEYPGSKGGNGGSGGGVARGTGGSDGSDGGPQGAANVGKGAHVTTREFGELTGKLYAGGGGGGYSSPSPTEDDAAAGGAGGGGAGALLVFRKPEKQAVAGETNTGGGGGGGATNTSKIINGAPGGSGIVCFRAAK